MPEPLRETAAIYELRPLGAAPDRTLLRTREDLDAFRSTWIAALALIGKQHGQATPIHLMPALPVSAAVVCGRARHPKANGPLRVYDLRRDLGGYQFAFEVIHDQP